MARDASVVEVDRSSGANLVQFSISERLLRRNVKRFRGGLVFKADRLLYHSTLGLRVIKKKKFLRCEPALRFRLQGLGVGVWDAGFRVQGSGFRVQGSGFGVWGAGCGV